MKALNEIQKEIDDLIKEGIELKGVKKIENKNRKKLAILYKVKIYLELNPKEESILSQKEEIARRIKLTENNYRSWVKENSLKGIKNMKSKYASESGLKIMKQQLSTLKYLTQ